MSIATHCSMLMRGGEHCSAATPSAIEALMNADAKRIANTKDSWFYMNSSQAVSAQPPADAASSGTLAPDVVFCVTAVGLTEIKLATPTMPPETSRALGLINGIRTVNELSLKLRAGEAEIILLDLEAKKFIERLTLFKTNAANTGMPHASPASVTPIMITAERLAAIKLAIASDLRTRLGERSDFVLRGGMGAIEQCESAVDLRRALRVVGDILLVEMGETGVREHLRAVGRKVMELTALPS